MGVYTCVGRNHATLTCMCFLHTLCPEARNCGCACVSGVTQELADVIRIIEAGCKSSKYSPAVCALQASLSCYVAGIIQLPHQADMHKHSQRPAPHTK